MTDLIGPFTTNIIDKFISHIKKKENKEKIMKHFINPILNDITNKYYSYFLSLIIILIFMIILLVVLLILFFYNIRQTI